MTSASLRRIKALIIKEMYQIIRDPSSILISIVLPMLLLFIYGYGVSLDADKLPIGLVMEDTSPDAQSFAKSLTNSHFFRVSISRDRRLFDEAITRGSIRGIVVIPSYFSSFRLRPDEVAPIQIITDGSEPNTANFVQNYVQSAWQNWQRQEQVSGHLVSISPVRVEPRFWYNEELISRYFLVPGSLAVIMTLIGTLLTALVVAREWERGTMEALMSTPVRIGELLIGKLIPYYLLGLISLALCVSLAVFLYGVPFRGGVGALILVSGVFLFSALGLGLLISTLSRSQQIAAQASLAIGFLPAMMLSGFIFEINSMPFPIQLLTYLIPARYFVSSLQSLFLVGNIWSLLLYNLVPMALIGTFLFFIIARHTTKRLD